MSLFNLKFTQGAPAKFLPGMIVKLSGHPKLILIGDVNQYGSVTSSVLGSITTEQVESYAQAIKDFEMDWLENTGIPAKAVV